MGLIKTILLAFAFGAVFGCGSTPASKKLPPMPDLKTVMRSATLGSGDVVEVRVYRQKELSGLFRVGSDGRFTYPMVGSVEAGGLTPSALASTLTSKLRDGFLRNPQVSVFVKEFNSKKVFVLGEVRKPGTFRYEDKMTIVQAITLAGGLKTLAAKDRLILTRVIQGEEKKFEVPFKEISQGRTSNVFLQPGDIVFVPESWL